MFNFIKLQCRQPRYETSGAGTINLTENRLKDLRTQVV